MSDTKTTKKPKAIKLAHPDADAGLNERLYDDGVLRQVNLVTYFEGLTRRVAKGARKANESFADRLGAILVRMSEPDLSRVGTATNLSRGTDRTKALATALGAFAQESRELALSVIPELKGLAFDEAQFWQDRINFHGESIGVRLKDISKRTVDQQWAQMLILGESIPAVLERWGTQRAEVLASMIRRQVAEGVEVRGIIEGLAGRQGFLQRSVEGLPSSLGTKLRTVANGSSSAGLTALQVENRDFIDDLVWVSVLDHRTSSICWSRHGKLVNGNLKGALPPAHPRCRSTTTPWSSPHGPIPTEETATEWMVRQTPEVQKRVMGPRRFELFETGKYDWPRDFISDRGKLWTLADLKRRTPARR